LANIRAPAGLNELAVSNYPSEIELGKISGRGGTLSRRCGVSR